MRYDDSPPVMKEMPFFGFGVSFFMLLAQTIPHNNKADMYVIAALIIGITILIIREINHSIVKK
jgi:hypothetical protein